MEVNNELLQQLLSVVQDLRSQSEHPYLDMKGAAKFLMISLSKMQKLSAERVFPVFKPNNGKTYFKRDDLIKYLETSKIKSHEEVLKESNTRSI
jgi:hypothetical protein